MRVRNLSPQQMFATLASDLQPRWKFSSHHDFSSWKAQALPAVLATLGETPPSVPLHPELTVQWLDRGIIKRRYVIDVGLHISAALQVNIPENLSPGDRLPALLCWHGHGPFGKDPVMGNIGSADVEAEITKANYDYGFQMARRGYVTYAIDWMGAGERNDQLKPHFLSTAAGRDWCNLYYLHATMLGMTPLALNLSHGRAATDFVSSLPEVDPGRLGVMGLSGGGTMTLWTGLTDSRFRAAEIICYSDLFALFGVRDINYCGSQITPGLFRLVDVPDLQGLLAPLPLLINIGAHDRCFVAANAMACFERVREIYRHAEAQDKLHLDLFAGDHGWSGRSSESFFHQYLAEMPPPTIS